MSDKADKLEVTRDIVLKMLDEKLISISAKSNESIEDRNKAYVNEVCKAFKTLYQTVSEVTTTKWPKD